MTGKHVALVTGASRGIGRGVSHALEQAGNVVFATGRTIDLAATPTYVPRRCDHRDDDQTFTVFEEIAAIHGRLDILVNTAWGGYERMSDAGVWTWNDPFWRQPMHRWASMVDGGLRPAFVCSALAARLMIPKRKGLIVNIGYWAAQKHLGNAIYGAVKAATDKLTADMAVELAPHGIAAVSLYPGLVRTQAVLEAAKAGVLDLANSESPEFIGRVIAALAACDNLPARSGQRLVAAELAREFGVRDVDGRTSQPLSLETA